MPSDPTQADVVARLRRLSAREMPEGLQPLEATCDLCGREMSEEHRHLLQIEERQLVCACEACYDGASGDAEWGPTGTRVMWLTGFRMPDDLWARFRIPIGLAFFLKGEEGVTAFYPSPAGATESDVEPSAWSELVGLNDILQMLEEESEVLMVNRMKGAQEYAIAPTDDAYRLVGLVRTRREGISGGPGLENAVAEFFAELEGKGGVTVPELEFWVLDAQPVPRAAAPVLAFRLRARDRSERQVYTVALSSPRVLPPRPSRRP